MKMDLQLHMPVREIRKKLFKAHQAQARLPNYADKELAALLLEASLAMTRLEDLALATISAYRKTEGFAASINNIEKVLAGKALFAGERVDP